jgi:VIT1/CCC1 family predicted Fe2+/Mn2+ transporter
MNQVEIPLKLTGIGAIKKELRDLKGQLANATDPKEMAALAQRAGELSDRLKDANEQVRNFSTGSKFEQVSNGIGGIKDSIMSLDFEEAAQKAKVFQTAVAGISSKDVSSAFKGLISTVGTLGKTFVQFGVMLLTNPIFLLVTVITAIVAGVVLFLNKIGLLGKAFEVIMSPIRAFVDGLKDILDYLGLTDFAGEEAARNEAQRQEEAAKMQQEKIARFQEEKEARIDLYNATVERSKAEIGLLESQGKSAEKLKKQIAAQELAEAKRQKQNLESYEQSAKIFNQETQFKKELVEADTKIIQAQTNLNNVVKDGADKYKEYQKARLDAARLIRDLEISLIKDTTERELTENEVKYQRLINDTKKNEKLKADEKKKIIALYEQIQLEEENKIQKKAKDEQLKQATELSDALNAVTKERADKKLAADLAEIQSQKDKAEKLKEYNDAIVQSEKGLFDARLGFAKGLISGLTELAGENKKIANALFLVDKALAIGEIIVNTQREISGYWSNPTWKLLPDGGAALATSASTAAKIRAATSIASIAASTIAKFIGGGGGGSIPSGGGSAPTATATAQATPAVNLFGQGNQLNQVGAPTGVESNQNITVQAVVSETDVTTTQTKIDKIKKNAEL